MTRTEIVAKVREVAAANGWHVEILEDAVRVAPREQHDDDGEPMEPLACVFVATWSIGLVWPALSAWEDDNCTQAVADWPEVQRMVSVLREALGVKP